MKPHRYALAVLGAFAVLAGHGTLALAASTDVTVTNAWVRPPPPGARTGAAFMTLTNGGAKAARLVAADNPASNLTELHTHLHEDGIMKMRQVKEIVVPAHGTAKLEPGGYHIMLIDLKNALKAGDTVPLTLHFDDGGQQVIVVPVRAADAAPAMEHMKH